MNNCEFTDCVCDDRHGCPDVWSPLAAVQACACAGAEDCQDDCSTGRIGFSEQAAYAACECNGGKGNYVTLLDIFGRTQEYQHLEHVEETPVAESTDVARGDVLGTLGSSGYSAGAHLHFELKEYDPVVDTWVTIDPFAGECPTAVVRPVTPYGLWATQGAYTALPAATLAENECTSVAGQLANDPVQPEGLAAARVTRPVSVAVRRAYSLLEHASRRRRVTSSDPEPHLGCPGKNTQHEAPYLYEIPGASGPVWIQHFFQQDDGVDGRPNRRFEGSAGDTAILYTDRIDSEGSPTDGAYLMRSGFWGAYRCLTLTEDLVELLTEDHVEFGGALVLGAPISDEGPHPAWSVPWQRFEHGYMYWQQTTNTVRVHVFPKNTTNERRHPRVENARADIDWAETARKCRDVNIRIDKNPPEPVPCGSGPEVCDGKDNDGDGGADEGCAPPPVGTIRLHYYAGECADSIDVTGMLVDAAGVPLLTLWGDAAGCRRTGTSAISCDIPADPNRTHYLRVNLISGIDGRPRWALEDDIASGLLRVEWLGQEIVGSPVNLNGVGADFFEYQLVGAPDGYCGDAECRGSETPSSCASDCLCSAGVARCQSGTLFTCHTDQRTEHRFPCGDGFCVGAQCGVCGHQCGLVGSSACENGYVRSCGADANGCREWGAWSPCGTGVCSASAQSCGACIDECSLGATECSGGAIRTCLTGSSGCATWSTWSSCPGTCAPSGDACNVPSCTADGQCPAPQHCQAGACVPDVCPEGADFCVGAVRHQCAANGGGSVALSSCPYGCAGGLCQAQCVVDVDCATSQFCQTGSCLYDVCAQGQLFCDGSANEVLECFANGSGSRRVASCATSCDPTTPRCCGSIGEPCCAGSGCAAPATCIGGLCSLPPAPPRDGGVTSPPSDAGGSPAHDGGAPGCSTVATVPSSGGVLSGATSGVSTLTSPNCGNGATASAPEAIYEWTPAQSGIAVIETCGSAGDTVLSVRASACDGSELVCSDDSCGAQSRVTLNVTSGLPYFIVVDGKSAQSMPYSLRVVAPSVAQPDAGTSSPPPPPTGLLAQYNQSGSYNHIEWTAVAGASQYRVYWATAPGVTAASTSLTPTSQTFTGHVSPSLGTTYYYRVAALNANGQGALSSEVSVTVPTAGQPSLSLSPPLVEQGQVVSVTGTNMTPNGPVTLHVTAPGGSSSTYVATADSAGTIATSISIDYPAVVGTHQVVATDATSGSQSGASTYVVTEVCNGLDDDSDGTIDEPSVCWRLVHRWQSNNGWGLEARCLGLSATTPPPHCGGYVHERAGFIIPAFPVPGTFEARQCSSGHDHVLVDAATVEFASLNANSAWSCDYVLGYPYARNQAPSLSEMPWQLECPVYRFGYTNSGQGGSHLFTIGSDNLTNLMCEGARADVHMSNVSPTYCFPSRPTGCPF